MTDMAKKRTTHRRYGRRFKKYFKRPKTIAIAPIAGFAGGAIFGSPSPSWRSPYQAMQQGDMEGVVKGLVGNITGLVMHSDVGPRVEIMGLINPFDFQTAPALKGLLWGMVAHKVANFAGQAKMFSGLPGPLKKLRV